MSTTKPTALESIDFTLLAAVSGGCHHQQSTQIVNVQAPPPAPAAQVAPPPAPMPGPQVQTSVSINGQPAA
jgi:hypothetical protein